MATTAGFKQQCPSCEAWVPIRDPNLIGKKIDCPKCKYRFVVEEPAAVPEEEEAETPKKAKKARRAAEEDNGSANGKGVATKGKAGKRRGEDMEEDQGKEKKSAARSPQ